MQWSLRLGRVNGVPVEAHWLLGLLLAWVAYTGWARAGLAGLISSTALPVAGFAGILVHEVAHTLQAQAINFPVRRIWLLPFGRLTLLGRRPEPPRDELRIALAAALAQTGRVWVTQVRLPARPPLDADADLWRARQALADADYDALPVYDREQMHGRLTAAAIRATLLEPSAMLRIQPFQLISTGQPSL